jgi:tRNA nucleotidyltransferase/poly(A) polymerase
MRETATRIVRRLRDAGFEAFWVGGCVRDFLLGHEPKDFDIATNATPEQSEKLFPKTIPVGRQFGVLLIVEDGHEFQIATFRAEADYRDGRRPEQVRFSHAREDAIRRDFTVNGLFLRSGHRTNSRLGRRRKRPARKNHPHDWLTG